MRIKVEGSRGGIRRCLTWDLLDYFDRATGATSMARTTAFPCTVISRLLLNGEIHVQGVVVPEMIGCDAASTQHVLDELEKRGVRFSFHDEPAAQCAPAEQAQHHPR